MSALEVLKSRLQSFVHAFAGIGTLVRSEANARIHAAATIAVVVAGVVLGIERLEWLAVTLAIGLVWTAEALNTAFEAICDVVSPDHHPEVGRAKDVAAGAVLIASLCATVVAGLVFVRRLLLLAA